MESNPRLAAHMQMDYFMAIHFGREYGGWFIEIPDLDGCCSQGETIDEALKNIEEAKELWIECHLEGGYSVPSPSERLVPRRTDRRPDLDGETFHGLVRDLRKDTAALSDLSAAASHPAYQEILSYGRQALPFIFGYLAEQKSGSWFIALRELTGQDPVPESLRGSGLIEPMADAWLEWGRKFGYL